MPHHRYQPAHERVQVPLTDADREWPSRRITQAPLWVPVDLRDGNQALPVPMDTPRKRRMFDLLTTMGFKEIEVAYPSASQTDFDFVRHLATSGAVGDDMTVSVFTPARTELIDRTLDSVAGLPRVLVHMYTACAPTWRNVVLGRDRRALKQMIVDAATHLMRRADEKLAGTDVRFEFSPEVFNLTEPDFALDLCNSITALWDACPDRPVVINLPATVEISTPNVYADQIEYMSKHLDRRDSVILSVHPHNDRGTGVACAELAVLAGAQRVEGCLFGNGERTGNVDLVTLVLNLYTQGVNPMIDFSDIDAVKEVVEECIRIPVHIRHPYAGALVHTAFSGTHQDAIAKGLARHRQNAAGLDIPESQAPWNVPYLPIDPADIGRTYEEVIRVNSQSGKGGIAHLLHTGHGLDLPPAMRPDFYREVQQVTDDTGAELSTEDLWKLYHATYLSPAHDGPYLLEGWDTRPTGAGGEHEFTATVLTAAGRTQVRGTGNGPLAALADAMTQTGITVDILTYSEHATAAGPDATAAAYAHCRVGEREVWGAGWDTSILTASVQAVMAAVNRAQGAARD
ncbi:2-isopropylmalate synthase [Streptomyces sp. TP-A0356]|uniref:2-isopropylmalate synthase n=1 Tax=Streptomyces sp. TP-A0356 TaxID=1359208 RepID=UPI00099F0710|nr:2-isopropylmalate synthase [Streptomyces sp. TP-A0356]